MVHKYMYSTLKLYVLIVAHTLPELANFLLSHKGAKYLFTERFNQDVIEIFFAQQRARGHRNGNPSVSQFMENTQALIVQKSLALGGSSSITRKRESLDLHVSPLSRPLPKRPCGRKINYN